MKAHKAPFWIRHYDVDAVWPRIKEAVAVPAIQDVLCHDFSLFLRSSGISKTYERGKMPLDYDRDWASDINSPTVYRKDYKPYWNFVIPGATLWMSNTYLELAKAIEPERPWRLIEGAEYAAVWDGQDHLFDPHGLAVRFGAREVWRKSAHYIHPVGQKRVCKPCARYVPQRPSIPMTRRFHEEWEPSEGAGILLF